MAKACRPSADLAPPTIPENSLAGRGGGSGRGRPLRILPGGPLPRPPSGRARACPRPPGVPSPSPRARVADSTVRAPGGETERAGDASPLRPPPRGGSRPASWPAYATSNVPVRRREASPPWGPGHCRVGGTAAGGRARPQGGSPFWRSAARSGEKSGALLASAERRSDKRDPPQRSYLRLRIIVNALVSRVSTVYTMREPRPTVESWLRSWSHSRGVLRNAPRPVA